MRTFISGILTLLLLISCNDKNRQSQEESIHSNSKSGKVLMEKYCISCHNPDFDLGIQTAPPLVMIKEVYKTKFPNKTEFVDKMKTWLKAPNSKTGLMKNSIKKYGVMPKLNYSDSDLNNILSYLYNAPIKQPKWFKNGSGESQIVVSKIDSLMKIIYATKKTLGKNLMGQLKQNGTKPALEFCNIQALNITDSLSKHFNVKIQRVSDKARNPNNRANIEDLKIIQTYKTRLQNGLTLEPIIKTRVDQQKTLYSPILTNAMCLQCHGKSNEDIKPEVLNRIHQLYPKDRAKDYTSNALRGVWKMTLNQ